jgi:uncharacterized Rmd1/YagE family protein
MLTGLFAYPDTFQLETAHSTKLEWIVIWLIVAEVVLQILRTLGY